MDAVPDLLALKGDTSITACIPARNEESTVGSVVSVCCDLARLGWIDQVLVVDDHSADHTSDVAREAGARVISNPAEAGKGEALRCAVGATSSDLLLFLDADVTNFSDVFVTRLVEPLLLDPKIQIVKATYKRSLNGIEGEGGRVTELVARPLLERFFPELADVKQPLAGECAVRRSALEGIDLSERYGIEIGLLIDIWKRFGRAAISDSDLGERIHRNRPLRELALQSRDVFDAVLHRACARSEGQGSVGHVHRDFDSPRLIVPEA